jgi:HemK-like putative methylase
MRIHLGHWIYKLGNRIGSDAPFSQVCWIIERVAPRIGNLSEIASYLTQNPNPNPNLAHSRYIVNMSLSELKKIVQMCRERYELFKPLQYILGDVYFAELNLLVEAPMLIPRPETEHMVHWIAEQFKDIDRKIRVLDIGCGSGSISLGLAKLMPDQTAEIIGIDMNPQAIDLARRNLSRNSSDISNKVRFDLIDITKSSTRALHSTLGGPFDLIISNPPYIPIHHWHSLQPEVKLWEDSQALTSGNSGLEFYTFLLTWIHHHKLLSHQPSKFPKLVLEIGYHYQSVTISQTLSHTFPSLKSISLHRDKFNQWRWISIF